MRLFKRNKIVDLPDDMRMTSTEGPLHDVVERAPDQPVDPLPAMVQRMAGELIASTALSKVQADIHGLRSEAQRQAENGDKLNRAFGEFREKEIQPLREELKSLRYNMGAKVEQTTTELAAFVGRLDGIVDMLLMAQGWGPERIAEYKAQHGLDSTQAPRAAEFAAYAEQQAELKGQLQALTESNQRLAEQNERLLNRLRARKRKRRSG